jgi:hypothetical protein
MIKQKRMRSSELVAHMGKGITCRSLAEKPEGDRPLGRTTNIWDGYIKMDKKRDRFEGRVLES